MTSEIDKIGFKDLEEFEIYLKTQFDESEWAQIKTLQRISVQLAQKEFLELLSIDNFRMTGFSRIGIDELIENDDNTIILVDILEEIKSKLKQSSEAKTK